jgi:hypothetical protein
MEPFTSTCASRDAVMGTPELFQLILLCLDQRSLLTSAQRVNKYWHRTIQKTPAIQRALFFEPFVKSYKGPPIFNPLLVEVFPPFFPSRDPNQDDDDDNDLCRKGDTTIKYDSIEPLFPTMKAHQVIRRPGASWTRMLVRQPPIRSFCEWHTEATQARTTIHTVKRRSCKKGLRMGQLYDMAMHPPLTIYWEGEVEKVAARYKNLEEKVRKKVKRMSNETDLTVGTHTGVSCIKPRPPSRILVKYRRGIEV